MSSMVYSGDSISGEKLSMRDALLVRVLLRMLLLLRLVSCLSLSMS